MERNKKRNRREWAEIIDEQERSGQSARAFCQARSIGPASFYQWRRRLRDDVSGTGSRTDEKGTFIDMGHIDPSGVSTSAGANPCVVTLDLGEGFKLTINRG